MQAGGDEHRHAARSRHVGGHGHGRARPSANGGARSQRLHGLDGHVTGHQRLERRGGDAERRQAAAGRQIEHDRVGDPGCPGDLRQREHVVVRNRGHGLLALLRKTLADPRRWLLPPRIVPARRITGEFRLPAGPEPSPPRRHVAARGQPCPKNTAPPAPLILLPHEQRHGVLGQGRGGDGGEFGHRPGDGAGAGQGRGLGGAGEPRRQGAGRGRRGRRRTRSRRCRRRDRRRRAGTNRRRRPRPVRRARRAGQRRRRDRHRAPPMPPRTSSTTA